VILAKTKKRISCTMHLVYNKQQWYNEEVLGGEIMFFNKTNQIIDLISEYLDSLTNCYDEYCTVFEELAYRHLNEHENLFDLEYAERVANLERIADKNRRNVIVKLLQGGLLVDNRKTMMRLIENIDKVADLTEDVIQMIVFEQLKLMPYIVEALLTVNEITGVQLKLFVNILSKTLTNFDFNHMMEDIKQVEKLESDVDSIEDGLIQELFREDLSLSEKLQYKELIRLVTRMSDHIEDLSDEVEIILASRRI